MSLWLARQQKRESLLYWQQANEFHKVSAGLSLRSAPLLHYYSFMNAAKALLAAKGIHFDPNHGVSEWNRQSTNRRFEHVGVKIKTNGVLPALAGYYQESETRKTYTLRELLSNLPFVHRTYCLTFKTQGEMFIPLVEPYYRLDSSGKLFFTAKLSGAFASRHTFRRLPPTFTRDESVAEMAIRSAADIPITSPSKPNSLDLASLDGFHRNLRRDLFYIHGVQTLWYVKSADARRIERQTPTLVLAAMHRLSEICRYKPLELDAYLAGRRNWLISEFINMSAEQFIDEMASEITGHQIMEPNIRPAS